MLWWEKYALQSMFKSAEQKQWGGGGGGGGVSLNHSLYFLKPSKRIYPRDHLIFKPEFPVFPRKW